MGFIIILLLAVIASASAQNDFGIPEYKRTLLGDSIDIASMKLLKEAYNESSDKNVVTSPLGILVLLSLYGSGSGEKSRKEIMTLLGSTNYKQLSESYSQLSEKLASMDPRYFVLANKILVSNKYTLNNEFSDTAKTYHSDVDDVNFDEPKAVVDGINKWSSNLTKGILSHPISEADIDPATVVALLDIIFFKGHWHVPFNANNTKEKDFNVDRLNSVKKPMMHLVQSLNYRVNEDMAAKMIELPYKESKFRMIVVLPDEVDGLPKVLEKASEKGLLNDIFRMYETDGDVILTMPKFETRTKIDLNQVLPKVGVSGIFEEESRGIVKGKGVKVSKALQEAFIKVDEEGATAAAFTGFLNKPMAYWSPISFDVNRPFVYVILYDDIVIFTGTYSH